MKLVLATIGHTFKTIYTVILAVGAVIAVVVAFWGLLDITGITQGQAKSMVEIPGELKKTIELGNLALQKYLDSK